MKTKQFCRRIAPLNPAHGLSGRIKTGLGLALLVAVTGCVGVVDDGYYGGGAVWVDQPDYVFIGGGYERGRDAHRYSDRGGASRGAAHPGGGRPSGGGGHPGGGGGHAGGGGGRH